MPKKVPKILRNFRVKVKSIGVNLFGFNVNFEVKVKKPTHGKRARKIALPPSRPSDANVVLETLHEIADRERKLAIRERDWEKAFLAALFQGWVQQSRKQSSAGTSITA